MGRYNDGGGHYGPAEGRGGWQGGGGGDRRRPSGGGRGGNFQKRGRYDPPIPDRFQVTTNLFEAEYGPVGNVQDKEWYMYSLTIIPKKYTHEKERSKNEDGKLPPILEIPDAHEERVKRFQDNIRKKGPNRLTRDILFQMAAKIKEMHDVTVATDGASIAVAPRKLFDEDECTYGVVLDDRYAYSVTLRFAVSIPLAAFSKPPTSVAEFESVRNIVLCFNVLINHPMAQNWITIDKTPNTFFLKEPQQRELLDLGFADRFENRGPRPPNAPFARYYRNPTPYAPFIGISQTPRFTDSAKFLITVCNKVDFLYRSSHYSPQGSPKASIPILNGADGTIAGIRIPNIHEKITNPKLRTEVERKLFKMTFTVRYEKGEAWVENCRARGRPEKYIERHRCFCKHEQRIVRTQGEPKVKWGCDEEEFDKKQGDKMITFNPKTYFNDIYGIPLKYPNMPIVNTRIGYYPLEFLFQEEGRVSHSNDDQTVKEVLDYHDRFAGANRVNHIAALKNLASGRNPSDDDGQATTLTEMLSEFHLSVKEQPLTVEARKLAPPLLEFGRGQRDSDVKNGSWSMSRKEFYKHSNLPSYAVIDCADGSDVIGQLFDTMKNHGMQILNGGCAPDAIQRLTVVGQGRGDPRSDEIYGYFRGAIQKAREFFLQPRHLLGMVTNVWDGEHKHLSRCLVTRGIEVFDGGVRNSRDGSIHAIHQDTTMPTHLITNQADTTKKAKARIKFRLRSGIVKDPCDEFRVDEIADVGYAIGLDEGDEQRIIPANEALPNPEPLFPLQDWQFECPALIFFIMRDKRSDLYDCVKMMSDIEFGVNTQCLVKSTIERQRGMGQYCSNVALKLNSKLYSSIDKSCAWKLSGVPWIHEVETMIFGYSLSHGTINGRAATAVGASVCLSEGMQMAQAAKLFASDRKSDIVPRPLLLGITQELAIHFFQHMGGNRPQRMVVYRDGGSDGSFSRIREEEVDAVCSAVCAMNHSLGSCAEPGYDGGVCSACAIPVTFIIAQRDHNVCITPANPQHAVKNNVPSGTLVEKGITSHRGVDGSHGFYLTAQGGLKGTSKPMYYRVVLNENAENLPSGCTPLNEDALHNLTYQMSFQYGSATKAPRKAPVLLNSEKLASRVMRYAGYLERGRLDCDEETKEFRRVDKTGNFTNGGLFQAYGCFDRRAAGDETEAPSEDNSILRPDAWKVAFRPYITA